MSKSLMHTVHTFVAPTLHKQTNKQRIFFIRKSFFFFSNLCISLLCYLFHFVWIFFRLRLRRPPKAFSNVSAKLFGNCVSASLNPHSMWKAKHRQMTSSSLSHLLKRLSKPKKWKKNSGERLEFNHNERDDYFKHQ